MVVFRKCLDDPALVSWLTFATMLAFHVAAVVGTRFDLVSVPDIFIPVTFRTLPAEAPFVRYDAIPEEGGGHVLLRCC